MSWFGGNSSAKLDEQLFNLKFSSKQLEKMAKKCEKEQAVQKLKIKKAIQQGNTDGARIYAENAMRKKTEGNNFLRLSSRLDAVASRIQTAITMKQVAGSMGSLVKGLDSAMRSMDLEKITIVMDKFEKQFENIDVQTGVMESSMGAATSLSTPEDQVDSLIQQVADEHGLEVAGMLDAAQVSTESPAATAASTERDADADLSRRLAHLRADAM